MGFAGEVKGYELAVVMSGELADRLPVITSYSIHYTKLYDVPK